MDTSRRSFLASLAVVAGSAATGGCTEPEPLPRDFDRDFAKTGDARVLPAATVPPPPDDDAIDRDPFTLGVASGDPSRDGFVIWARLCWDPRGGGLPARAIDVRWEVAADAAFEHVVASDIARALPEHAHSLHVEITGMPADAELFYRFTIGAFTSAVGRACTTPPDDAMPDGVRFVIASCQRLDDGLFVAHESIAEETIDFVLFLGDYIYETNNPNGVRPTPDPAPVDLEGYRTRYALARQDPSLQAAHARAPWIVTFDDHEVENNYAGIVPEVAQPDFEARRAAAYQAFWEHTPMRGGPPVGGSLQVHRSMRWGALFEAFVLDTRQYRSDQLCGDVIASPCAELATERGTLLGDAQERWLVDGVRASRARWIAIAQQIPMIDTFLGADPVHPDAWEGYPSQRRRVTELFAETSGVLVLSGDRHAAYCGVVHRDASDPTSDPVAVELQCTSISTGGDGQPFEEDDGRRLVAANPALRYANSRWRGYTRITLLPDAGRADFRAVRTVRTPGLMVFDDARFELDPTLPAPRRI